MKKQKLLAAGIAVLTIANIAALLFCCFGGPSEPETMVSVKDLSGHDVYVYNVTCPPDKLKHRTVEDAGFIDEIAEMCARATPFRPVTEVDLPLGTERHAVHVIFENGAIEYRFAFFDMEKQLDLESVHRDSPVINVSKSTFDDAGQAQKEWDWFCILPAADYAALYEQLQQYSGGEIV